MPTHKPNPGKVLARVPKAVAAQNRELIKRGRGRPSIYSDELAKEICDMIAEGKSLAEICMMDHMPNYSTVTHWTLVRPDFSTLYSRARRKQQDSLFDSMLQVARDKDLGADERRVQLDTIKWVLGKMAPKKYGDKQHLEVGGTDGGPITTLDLSKLTHEELKAFHTLRSKLADSGGD